MAIVATDEQVDRAIERVAESKQPAFGGDGSDATVGGITFADVYRWSEERPPDYAADLREYDRWHHDFMMKEPHLRGVVGQAVSLIANRGYTLTGGKILVNRSKSIFDNANTKKGSPVGQGYRDLVKKLATAFYYASFGAPAELGRDAPPRFVQGMERYGPLRAIWSADPTLFRVRTRNLKQYPMDQFPYVYYGGKKVQYWRHGDLLRVIDNPNTVDEYGNVGMSAVAICRELAEILVAVYQHDKEKLGSRAPKGLLLLQNITPSMWETAMAKRNAKLNAFEREHYGGVGILARAGVEQIDAKLIALSTIPDGMERRETIDLLMYLYALVFKFSPDEFWPVRSGSFGRGQEAAMGIERASRKGDMEFLSQFRDLMQLQLPSAVLLEYDETDVRGEKLRAEVDKAYADFVVALYDAGGFSHPEGPLISKQQALTLLANKKLIPPEWTEVEEEATASDLEVARMNRLRQRLMDTSEEVRRAMAFQNVVNRRGLSNLDRFDIVRYEWPSDKFTLLWRAAEYPHYGRSVVVTKEVPGKKSQDVLASSSQITRAILYEDDDEDFTITDEDVDAAIEDAEDRHGAEMAQILEG